MKTKQLLVAAILSSIMGLSAGCGGDQASNNSQITNEAVSTAVPVPESSVAVEEPDSQAKLPFDMPLMPGARYKSGTKFSKGSKKRQPEAIATIIATGTTLEVVAFYEKALTEHGFTATLGNHNDLGSASVRGVRENGETFSVTSMRGGSKANEGECQTAIIATKPKREEKG